MSVSEHSLHDPPIPVLGPRPPSLHEQVVALDGHLRLLATQLDAVGQALHHLHHALAAAAPAPRRPPPTLTPPAGLLLRLLGPIELRHDGAPVLLDRRGKAEAVLTALALARGRRVPPDRLAEWIWPERAPDEARRCLQTTVSAIRRTVQRHDRAVDPIPYRGDAYRLDAVVVTDVDLVEGAWDRALAFERAGAGDLALATLAAGVALYRDDVDVDAFADVRFVIDRERLAGLHLHMLGRLGTMCFERERWEECIGYATRLLAHDPGSEAAHRLVIRSYVRLGQRSRGLHHYRLCRRILREHFDADLEPETTALLRELL